MKKLSLYTSILVFLCIPGVLLFPGSSSAHSIDYWAPSAPQTPYALYGVTYSSEKGLFVAVGEVGTILTSSDGGIWGSPEDSGTVNWLGGIAYGNSVFVSVGGFGTILTSSDGTAWNNETSPTTNHLNGVAYGNNAFVAVGVLGKVFTSSNGLNWTARNSGLSSYLQGVTFGNSTFVAVGGSGTIITSSDGVTWTKRVSATSDYLQAITFGNDTFIAVGASGTIVTSSDGITWTKRTSGTTNGLLGITYGNNLFAAVGVRGTILTSPDGLTWTMQTASSSLHLNGITHGKNIFATVGDSGAVLTASNAIVINSGAVYATSPSVTLTLSCDNDTGHECVHMQFSDDNMTWSSAEEYSPSSAWTLPSGDGPKTVYTRFQDDSSSWSDIFSDSIFLDANAPATTAFPTGGIYYDPYLYVTLTCNDGSGLGCDKIYYTTDGSSPTTSSAVYSIPVRLTDATPTIRFFSVDKAGNQETPVKSETYIFDPPLDITTTSLSSGLLGLPYSQTLIATGGFPPFNYTWTILSGIFPGDLILNSPTGEISGTPTISGTFNFTVQVTDDDYPGSLTKELSITIAESAPVMNQEAPSSSFWTIQDVYDASETGTVIEAQAVTFTENVDFNREIEVTLKGGFDPDYATNDSLTTIDGTVTISSGTVIIENVSIR